jgi:hypothetical protein
MSCEDRHFACGISLAVVDAVVRAATKNDPAQIRQIVSTSNGAVTLNSTRQLIQVANCRGAIVAQMPISASVLAAARHNTAATRKVT